MRILTLIVSVCALAGLFQWPAQDAHAAELVMFEQDACPWCARFNHEIAPIYPKTAEGQRAPLRRVNIDHPVPADLAFIEVERLTPLFVLIDNGREIGRIRGYPGDDHFWGLLGILLKRLDVNGTRDFFEIRTRSRLHAAR